MSDRRPTTPQPPLLGFSQGPGAAAVMMAFNGVEYRAVLETDDGMAQPEDVARMLEALAGEVRAHA